MKFNFVDAFVLVLIVIGYLRGSRRGLSAQLPSTVGILVFFFLGMGLFRLTAFALSQANVLLARLTGGTSLLVILIAAYFLVRHFRGRIRSWAEKRYPDPKTQQKMGGIMGAIWALTLAAVLVLTLERLLPGVFVKDSAIGSALNHFVLPVYKITHN